ncbi:MAG: peptidase M48 [Deltaproteobacteria bacterium]|nr:MAG: peptidase M48 [Deltaproteobacteria bacterium]
MNIWLVIILLILIVNYFIELIVSVLNLKSMDEELPAEFSQVFDKQEYAKSQNYLRVTTGFSLIKNSTNLFVTIAFILAGGFNYADLLARSFGYSSSIITGLIFTGILTLFSFLAGLPFSIYSTFVIEENFGFNRTTVKTFCLDIIKGALLAVIIGGPLLAIILCFFESTGKYSWLYCWLMVVLFSFVLQFLAPVLIMPLFNKFTPLEDGELKDRITSYARKENFAIQGIFTMDGSKRSSKLNAFFTGFGKFRKIVFFDTLIEKLSVDEIVAVLAHEMGHFKLKHIYKMMAASILQTGIMFYLLSLVLNNQGIFEAFGMENVSVYASLTFFGFIYSPVNFFISIIFKKISRKHEYEADRYAASTSKMPEKLISSLKVLSKANLTNLRPHPFHVFLHHSHPPVLERIEALRKL